MSLRPDELIKLRLQLQQLARVSNASPKDIVGQMGALQAQDANMVQWAVGCRQAKPSFDAVNEAVKQGTLIRTHLLRPTWHLVSADDIYWMLELSAPQILGSMKSRNKELGLTAAIIQKSNTLLEKLLKDHEYVSRETISATLEKAKILTNESRLPHLLAEAEMAGIVCSHEIVGHKQTYTLLSRKVPQKTKAISREKALQKIATIYFSSHGPATLADFIWWSGLHTGDARNALSMAKSDLQELVIDDTTYWLPKDMKLQKMDFSGVHLLPAFDEFLVAYKNREAILASHHNAKAISNNGIFRPVILANEKVIGTWGIRKTKDKWCVETSFFKKESAAMKKAVESAGQRISQFYQKDIPFKHL